MTGKGVLRERDFLCSVRPKGTDQSQAVRKGEEQSGTKSARGDQCLAVGVFLCISLSPQGGKEAQTPQTYASWSSGMHLSQKACQREGGRRKVCTRKVGAWADSEVAQDGPGKSSLWRDLQKASI